MLEEDKLRYLRLLSHTYRNRYAAFTEIINLEAILNLPKGTEHFISDIHGEYEAFRHILNNASGVIKDKVNLIFKDRTKAYNDKLCTIIYYPEQMLKRLEEKGELNDNFYRWTIRDLILLAGFLSSKYTRSKVRKAIPHEFAYIIDELMHAKADEDNNRSVYHKKILDSIIETKSAVYFIESLSDLIKRLAVDRLHVLGDIFDRGPHAERCMDLLMQCSSLDLQWGNHDVLWMGACCGSAACAATAVRINVKYNNFHMLENGYGISLRKLAMFASATYKEEPGYRAIDKAISVICLKLQGQLIKRHQEYSMNSRLMLEGIDLKKGTISLNGCTYELRSADLPTIDPKDPYKLSKDEELVAKDLVQSFKKSSRLYEHVKFLYAKGSMYKCCNGNLLFHGCVPLKGDGDFASILCNGRYLSGKAYLDFCEKRVREAFIKPTEDNLDFLWYMWCGENSPLSGRLMKTFERILIKDKSTWHEPRNPYYDYYYNEDTCNMILMEFGLDQKVGHIINGHTPIKVKDGEMPVRGNGKLLVIDGGFCRAYQKTTGIAGYTLIYNSHTLRLKAHTPFTSIEDALNINEDIGDITVSVVETFPKRRMVADTDDGVSIRQSIADLKELQALYESGEFVEQ